MKIITRNSIQITILILCFFALGNTYSQSKKSTNKTLFGKTVKPESINPKNGKIRCATVEYEKYLQEKNPKRMTEAQFETWLNPLVNKQKAMKTRSESGGIITIPVVVHVIYNGQAIGVAPNITDTQVESQIRVLNEDFRKITGSPGDNSTGADTQIQFALAQVDPNGNPTNGIDRISLCQDSWSENEMNATIKPTTIWDPNQYMNMWTIQFTDTDLLGYAQFPDASGLPGLDANGGPANTDGIVANYTVFGSKAYNDGTFLLEAPYDKGRTMTHEVGHWLGLRHIWGDGGNRDTNTKDCNASDYCNDTPQAGWQNYDCVTTDSCPAIAGNDMVENYMDYTEDACMNIFTNDQKTRLTTIINNAARRNSLRASTKNIPLTLSANDAELKLEANCDVPACGVSSNQTIQKIVIYNRGSSNLTSVAINYNINGGGNNVYNWTGNLATNKFDVIGITINASTTGTINTSIATVNGVTDERVTNNNASGTFIIPTVAPNYTYTDYVFRLQQDLWGSETSWDLKDDSGTILFSGGDDYTDKVNLPLPDLITQNWTLANNKCYTFTIKDSQSDGICCGEGGDGFYDIKASDGTLITSGSSFYSSKSFIFTTDTLSTNKHETFDAIFVYPNPTKSTLNIHINNTSALPDSYFISNTLGQKIIQKGVSKEADLTINTSALANGVYFITITKDDLEKTLKFIKE